MSTVGTNAALLAACISGLVCFNARAQWGSIRANNRGEHDNRSSRTAPVIHERTDNFRSGEQRREEDRRFSRTGREIEEHRRAETLEHRRFDFDDDRRRGFYWSGIQWGHFYNTLPSGYMPVYVAGTPYYYYQGAYYQPEASGYIAVTPPVGAVVPALPPGAEPIEIGASVYYYAGGAFYLQTAQGFAVVTPPLGVTVGSLPPGAIAVYNRGRLYYQVGGTYFMPSMQGGVTVYTTVQP